MPPQARPETWLLTATGIRSPDGEVVPDVPIGAAPVVAGVAEGGHVAVIVDEREVWTRSPAGKWSKEVWADHELYSIARTSDGRLLVGTESARLAWVEAGDLRFLQSFDAVPERPMWDTPYGAPPELRSLAVATDGTIYANVHVGWIVRSRDGGRTWKSIRKGLDRDVHMVAAHPTKPETVFAATAVGFHISHDHGESFIRRREGMPYYYQRAVACFPDTEVYLASTAKHNGGAGALLFRSDDEGVHWTRAAGLPDRVNRNINTHQVVALAGGLGLAVLQDSILYESNDWGASWRERTRDLPSVNAILPVPRRG